MESKKAEIRGVISALALLLLVSLYRQLSIRLLPGDYLRPYIVYAVYLSLIFFWCTSIRSRFTQRSMRVLLLSEAFVMLFWLSIRFVQEAFVYQDIYLVRILGYYINIPSVAIPLLGFYTAFGLGRGDDYRFSRWYYLLLLPAALLIAACLTNESHHLIFSVAAGEPQPNLYFHPNYGIFVIYGWGLALIAARTVVIYRRSRPVKNNSPIQILAPFLEPLFLLAFCIPYTVSSFWVSRELVEFSAGMFFIEAVSWELFIWLGLIPVNTQYKAVFDRSTVGMQIVSDSGEPIVRSHSAPDLTRQEFCELVSGGNVAAESGQELQAYKLQCGYLIWQRDVTRLRSVIIELRKSAAELKQESAVLSQELKLRSEEAAVAEQNRIYDRLSIEVGPQLRLLEMLLKKQDVVEDKTALFQKICLIGAYVKRRCGMRLIEQSDGTISSDDLYLCFSEFAERLRGMGIDVSLSWCSSPLPSPAFAMTALDVFEFILEYQRFELSSVHLALLPEPAFSISVRRTGGQSWTAPAEELSRMGANGLYVVCESFPDGYTAIIREGGKTNAEKE
jgi:hypothetical protein